MGKKYLDTKKGSLESSILGVWEEAAETKEGAMKRLATGGKEALKGYKKKPKKEEVKEASGDKEAYQKFFNKALKKFKVGSPAELKGDQKKKFYDYIDANWEGDNEKAEQVREFKVQSMKDTLMKVWDIDEGKLPPALQKAIDKKKKDKGEEEEEPVKKKNEKSDTGKPMAKIDMKPKDSKE